MASDQTKIFVGGISRETTKDSLKQHFNKYGQVLDSVIAKDRTTGNPRGFGFVWFSDPDSANKALLDSHVILGRMVEVKRAVPKTEYLHNQQLREQHEQSNQQLNRGSSKNGSNGSCNVQLRTKKVFVGGLSANLTKEEFKNYFERFGRITDVAVIHDSTTRKPRGFGFVTFDSEESVENVMQKNFHELNDRFVEVKRAVPKEGNNGSNSGYNSRFGGVRWSPHDSYRLGTYPAYTPTYGLLPGYAPIPAFNYGTSIYHGGYPTGGYSGFSYGVAPFDPRSHWNGPGTFGAQGCFIPYPNASMFPSYMNGGAGIMDMTGGYNVVSEPEVSGKLNQVVGDNGHLPADIESSEIEERSNGAVPVSEERNQRSPDGQFQ